jgi:hypothetical protein
MTYFVERLGRTVTARWYVAVTGTQPRARSRLETRVRCYDALTKTVGHLLETHGGPALARAHIRYTDLAPLPKSTVHHTFRRENSGALVAAIAAAEDRPLRETQPYRDGVENCSAELKVWTYWPYRDGWLTVLAEQEEPDRRLAVESLILVLAEWAEHNPAVATHVNYAPPVAAVEDLMVVSRARISPEDATSLLAKVVTRTLEGRGHTPESVLNHVHDELMFRTIDADDGLAYAKAETTNGLSALARIIPTLLPPARARLADELRPAFADIMELLCRPT